MSPSVLREFSLQREDNFINDDREGVVSSHYRSKDRDESISLLLATISSNPQH